MQAGLSCAAEGTDGSGMNVDSGSVMRAEDVSAPEVRDGLEQNVSP